MKDQPEHQNDAAAQEPIVPARLVEALGALHESKVSVPTHVDEAVLAQARSHLQKVAAPSIVPFPRWLAAAAAVLAGLGLTFLLSKTGPEVPAFAREDVDRNGRVDMLDAFALARKLQAGSVSDRVFDLNGDGVIDQRDIDSIAAHAVKVHKG
ncbi:MAG TPA: dockerin type I domain-containing protein [Verrucomicrobiae bacterium]|nr:dockerin type I domain-containing protein [Verrucomicrobiae bacterium]